MVTDMTRITAEGLVLPIGQMSLAIGGTVLPRGGMTVGSRATATNEAAVHEAAQQAGKR